MNNVQIMSTSPQAGTAKNSMKSSQTFVSKTSKSSGFDDVLQKSRANAQDPKATAKEARDAAKTATESATDDAEASAEAVAAEKNPAATKTKKTGKGKDAKQGADDKAVVTDDTDALEEAAKAAVDAKLVLAQALVGADTQGQELTAMDVAKGQSQKTMLAMLSGQNLAQDASAAVQEEAMPVTAQATAQAQNQSGISAQQLLAQMNLTATESASVAEPPLADLQSLSTRNVNVQQMPQMQAQVAETVTPLFAQTNVQTATTASEMVKTSDFANLLGTDVTMTNDDLALTQQVTAAPQTSGSSLGDFLQSGSQASGQSMTEMLQTADGTEAVTQLPEEAAFDKAPATEAAPTQTGIASFAQTLQNIDGTQSASAAQAAQQPQTDYDVPQQIVDQARLIQRGQDTEMVIHLKPEHLGDLTLRVSVGADGAVNASFHSNNAEVRTIIENTLVQLKQELNNQGIKVDNVGVYAGLSDGGLPQDSGQQGWQQQSSQGQQHSTRESAEAFEDGQELAAALAAQREGNAATDGVDYRV